MIQPIENGAHEVIWEVEYVYHRHHDGDFQLAVGWPLLILTSAVAVYLSVRFKFFQFHQVRTRHEEHVRQDLRQGRRRGRYFPVQACCTALASTLGVGNIAGVSVAIATGGPGAVFWMWAVALMGFIVKFSEITLGMAYRERDPETGRWHGGFYWYVRRGLGKSWKWLGIFWAVILGCAMVFAPACRPTLWWRRFGSPLTFPAGSWA